MERGVGEKGIHERVVVGGPILEELAEDDLLGEDDEILGVILDLVEDGTVFSGLPHMRDGRFEGSSDGSEDCGDDQVK